ncbi:MAG: hypothetical protein ABIH34_05345 [Nanoarchaeota archaeon]
MSLFSWAEGKFHKFTIWDVAVFKIAVGVFGMILGAYFASFVTQYIMIFWGIFIVSYGYLMIKMLKK